MKKNYLNTRTPDDINEFINIRQTLVSVKYSYFINSYEKNPKELFNELISILKENFLNYDNIYNCLIYSSMERYFKTVTQSMVDDLYKALKGKYDMNGKTVILFSPEEESVLKTENDYFIDEKTEALEIVLKGDNKNAENEEKELIGTNVFFKIACSGFNIGIWEDAEELYDTLDAIEKNQENI